MKPSSRKKEKVAGYIVYERKRKIPTSRSLNSEASNEKHGDHADIQEHVVKKVPKFFKGNSKEAGSSSMFAVALKQGHGKSLPKEPYPIVIHANHSRFRNCLYVKIGTCMDDTDMHKIEMEEGIFGDSYVENIMKEEINEILHHKILGATVICIYIRYLYEKLVYSRQLNSRFFFLSPHRISAFASDPKRIQDYIVDVIVKNNEDDKLFIAPYNSGQDIHVFYAV